MFKYFVLPLLFVAVTSQLIKVEDCNCWDEFEARIVNDKVLCVGKILRSLQQCNVPKPPMCVCTEQEVTGILNDGEGTWCFNAVATRVDKQKWECENKEAWAQYKIDYAEYERKAKKE